jgi:hypothetical protein
MKGKIGFALFSIGIAIGVTGGAKAPVEGSTWPDTLVVFALGAGVSIVGLFLWWQHERNSASHLVPQKEVDNHDDPILALHGLSESLSEILARFQQLPLSDFMNQIQAINERWVFPVVAGRHRINNRLGPSEGANIMISFAYCERMINRSWSAAADNHRSESFNSLQDAHAAITQIVRNLPDEKISDL